MEKLILTNLSHIELKSIISECLKEVLEDQQNKPTKADELISRKEASKILGLSFPTLRKLTKEGTIPSYKIGKQVRYKKTEVLKALTAIDS